MIPAQICFPHATVALTKEYVPSPTPTVRLGDTPPMDGQVPVPPGDGAAGEYHPDNQQGLYPDSVLPPSTPGDQDATPYYERTRPEQTDAVEEVPPSGSHDGGGEAPSLDAGDDSEEYQAPPPC